MKWEAASMRRSAVSQRSRASGDVARFGGDAGQCVEGEDFDVGMVVASGLVEDRDETCLGVGFRSAASIAASRHSPSAACSPPPAARCHAAAASRAVRAALVLAERPQDAPEVDSGERRQPYVAGGLGLVDRQFEGGSTGVVVAGLALRSSETGQLVRLGLQEAETPRRFRGATEVDDGIVEPVLDAGQLAEHRFAANVQPRVVDVLQPVLDVIDGVDAALLVTG